MSIRPPLPTADVIQEYVQRGIVNKLLLTPEETEIRSSIETKKQSRPGVLPTDPRLVNIAKAYFAAAKQNSDPQTQAVLFFKAREVAIEVQALDPSMKTLITESVFEEALACEKAAKNSLDEFSWILRGAKTITPDPEKINDSILDPSHVPAKYSKGSQLWEAAAKLTMNAPIPPHALNFRDALKSQMDSSTRCFEAAARCSQRAYLLYRAEKNKESKTTEKIRLHTLLKRAAVNLQAIETYSDLSAGLRGRIVNIMTWQHNFKPQDPKKAEKLSKKHLKVAELYAQEAQTNSLKKFELYLEQIIHIHSAAQLTPSHAKKIELLKKAIAMAAALKKAYPATVNNPLFYTQSDTMNDSFQLDWAYGQELADLQKQGAEQL